MTQLMTFEELDLSPQLLKALAHKGYNRPTAIQQATIPAALEGRDLLGSAPTGTGKTARFFTAGNSAFIRLSSLQTRGSSHFNSYPNPRAGNAGGGASPSTG